jgi:hypothetical protein
MHQEFLLTRSNYYSQFFNTAIFFDPFRIYFNSAFESAALSLYYNIQQKLKSNSSSDSCYYVLLYSDMALFEKSFGKTDENVVVAKEGNDYIVGIKSTTELNDFSEVIKALDLIV